jgi:hypothetical protein
MNRMKEKEESCPSETRDFSGKSEKNRTFGDHRIPEKRSILLPLGQFRQPADGEKERDR